MHIIWKTNRQPTIVRISKSKNHSRCWFSHVTSFLGLHRDGEYNIEELVLIQGNSSIQIHRILLHLEGYNLDNGTSLNEIVQVEETLKVFIQIKENLVDNILMEMITHLDKGIFEFVIIHLARVITVEEVIGNLWMTWYDTNQYGLTSHCLISLTMETNSSRLMYPLRSRSCFVRS